MSYARYNGLTSGSGGGGGGGTVTSVGLSDGSSTAIFNISGSPVTGSGTLVETLKTQTANTLFAGPTTGSAAQPTFRAVVAADLPTGNLTDAGTDGIVVTGGTGAVIGSGTSLAQHVADTTHNGYLSSTDWNTFNGKQAAGNYITALTGDVTASGPGSVAATLATVNSNVGSFGSSTAIPSFTVNGKGLITAASTNVVIAPAGTLTGTTLAANVVSSSLTSVGTIGTGVWQGTAVAIGFGGTGQATKAAGFDALSPMTTGGDLIYGGTSGTGTRLANGSSGQALLSGGGTAAPTWGTLSATNGGTSFTTYATGDTIYASASNTLSKRTIGNSGDVLTVSGGVPTWAAPAGAPANSEIWLQLTNGYGSTNTNVLRWSNTIVSTGTDLTLTQSAANGDKITINTTGRYCVMGVADSAANGGRGVAVNSSQLTTSITSNTFTTSTRLFAWVMTNADRPEGNSVTRYFSSGDILYFMGDASAAGANNFMSEWIVSRIS